DVGDGSIERLADAASEYDGFGELQNRSVHLACSRISAVHHVGTPLEGLGDRVRPGGAAGAGNRGFDDVTIGKPAKRRGRVDIGRTHRRVPRSFAGVEWGIGSVAPGAAYREHERGLPGIVWIEVSLAILEAHVLGPVDAERP